LRGFFVSPARLAKFILSITKGRHCQRHHRTANSQGVALALFLKQKKSKPRQFTCADGVLLFGILLEIF